MLRWNHSAEAASRALPSRVHAQPAPRLTRLEIVSSEVEQSLSPVRSDDFWWLLWAKSSSKVAAAVTVTLSHIVTYCHILLATLLQYLSPLYASTPSTFFFWGCWNSFRMDHKECRTTRPPGSAHAMPSMISGRDKVLVGRKKLAMDRSLRPPIFKLQWSQNNTNDNTNVQMQSSSWQKLRDKWGQVIFWML